MSDAKGAKVSDQDKVTIPKSEYDGLLEDRRILSALRCSGVDNWEGYDAAMELLEDD